MASDGSSRTSSGRPWKQGSAGSSPEGQNGGRTIVPHRRQAPQTEGRMPGKESPPYPSHHSPARLQLLGYLRERSEGRQWGAGRLPRAGSETPSISSREDLGGTLVPLTSPFLILLREITSSMTLLCCSPVPGTHASLASFPTLLPSLLTL